MNLQPGYAFFYLEGREERTLKADIDTTEIAKKMCEDGGSIHERLHEAASKAAQSLFVDRKKRQWLEDFEEDIKTAGVDPDQAYAAWCEGRVDELVFTIEGEVVEEMNAFLHGDEEDDADEDDDDEDGDDDED